ncbi:hypothetical protein BFN67_17760 [Pseudaminobacter manganicus]|uniref:DUF4167 domain-containing protein n=2 Tax=Manganibacter manganicus TaxID=1873176 RepID=A0A1V8RQL0_9HYPH|nr:hypothetical protein BFN67_17760 [Pseudaminobacter manganicus]
MRGRNNGGGNNNNRKGPNPLNRNYESNGPDVKIRGSAQQIAEKYATLARDAMSSGDRVIAENYLQHAEHYNRIIAAAQAQMPIQQVQHRNDDFDDDLDDSESSGDETQAPATGHGAGPQPVIEGTPAEIALNGDDGSSNNNNRNGRRNGNFRQNRQGSERAARDEHNGTGETSVKAVETDLRPAAKPEEAAPSPVAENLSPADLAARVERNESGEEASAPRATRRPRRPRAKPDQSEGAGAEAAPVEVGEG